MTIICDKCGKRCHDIRKDVYDEDYDSESHGWSRADDPSKSAVCKNCPRVFELCNECFELALNNEIALLKAGKCI
jgi:hypothetical protein